jgi:hypothetical protein
MWLDGGLEHLKNSKDRDEVNRRDVYECDGGVCDRDVKGVSSIHF